MNPKNIVVLLLLSNAVFCTVYRAPKRVKRMSDAEKVQLVKEQEAKLTAYKKTAQRAEISKQLVKVQEKIKALPKEMKNLRTVIEQLKAQKKTLEQELDKELQEEEKNKRKEERLRTIKEKYRVLDVRLKKMEFEKFVENTKNRLKELKAYRAAGSIQKRLDQIKKDVTEFTKQLKDSKLSKEEKEKMQHKLEKRVEEEKELKNFLKKGELEKEIQRLEQEKLDTTELLKQLEEGAEYRDEEDGSYSEAEYIKGQIKDKDAEIKEAESKIKPGYFERTMSQLKKEEAELQEQLKDFE